MTNVIAQTILEQLGGRRFVAMTGTKDFVSGENYLKFKLPRGVKNKATHVMITLQPNDTYFVEFLKWNGKGLVFKAVSQHNEIYCNTLQELFTTETGFYTKF